MHRTVLTCALLAATLSAPAAAQRRGILGHPAPELRATEWLHVPEGAPTPTLDALRGKVVYLYFFQSWCPGCHSDGFPTLKKQIERYADHDDVAFLAVQTVFEGFGTNTLQGAERCAKKFGLEIPVGHDPGPDGRDGKPAGSTMLREYRAGGTPWTIVIDKNGVVRFNDFHADADGIVQLIDDLRDAEPLVGSEFGALAPAVAVGDDAVEFADSKLTLLRWWTDTCPHCAASLPALAELARKTDGLRVVGIYHPKPPRPMSDAKIRKAATRIGLDGPLLHDPKWELLARLQAAGLPRKATSVSVLVDATGVVRWFHAGPRLHENEDGRHPAAERGLRELERVVHAALQPPRDDDK